MLTGGKKSIGRHYSGKFVRIKTQPKHSDFIASSGFTT